MSQRKPPFDVVCWAEYTARTETEISLKARQKYTVVGTEPTGMWWQAKDPLSGNTGWFPSERTRAVDDASQIDFVLTEEQQYQAMEAFRKYDADGSGTIDKGELKNLLRVTMGTKVSDMIIDLFIQANWQLGDTDGNGTIDQMEFLRLYSKLFLEQNTQNKPKQGYSNH